MGFIFRRFDDDGFCSRLIVYDGYLGWIGVELFVSDEIVIILKFSDSIIGVFCIKELSVCLVWGLFV